jgi:hypothetical protein
VNLSSDPARLLPARTMLVSTVAVTDGNPLDILGTGTGLAREQW